MPFRFNPLTGALDYFKNTEVSTETGGTSNGLTIVDGVVNLNLVSETTTGALSSQDYIEFKSKKEYKMVSDVVILTTEQINTKKIVLSSVPVFPETASLIPTGGVQQVYGEDYTINGQELSWDSMGLDSFLEEGEEIKILYQIE
jgi:hypothetical protein